MFLFHSECVSTQNGVTTSSRRSDRVFARIKKYIHMKSWKKVCFFFVRTSVCLCSFFSATRSLILPSGVLKVAGRHTERFEM